MTCQELTTLVISVDFFATTREQREAFLAHCQVCPYCDEVYRDDGSLPPDVVEKIREIAMQDRGAIGAQDHGWTRQLHASPSTGEPIFKWTRDGLCVIARKDGISLAVATYLDPRGGRV